MRAAPSGGDGRGADAPQLTVVVPAHNEADRLQAGLERLVGAADTAPLDLATIEVLVVDDGSSDGTVETASRLLAELPDARVLALPKNLGKGAAVRAGILAARGRRVCFADADMAIDPAHLPDLLEALEHADVAVGSRAVGGRVDYGSWPRTLAGRCFNRAVRLAGAVDLDDTQCGFKGFNRGPALLLAHLLTTNGYAFDVELLWLADRLALDVAVVPVSWVDVPGSTVRPVHDAARMLLDVLEARRRHRYVVLAQTADVAAPRGAVALHGDRGPVLVAGAAQLAAMRRAVAGRAPVRLVTLEELAAMGLGDPVPAEVAHAGASHSSTSC